MTLNPTSPLLAPHTAVLFMDFQVGIGSRIPHTSPVFERAAALLTATREAGALVGFVRVALDDAEVDQVPAANQVFSQMKESEPARAAIHPDSPDTQFLPNFTPLEGDIVVRKRRFGAFSTTDLHEQLQAKGVRNLILSGITTSGVILSTVRAAADLDYGLIVASDACDDGNAIAHNILLEQVFPRQAAVKTVAQICD